MRCKYAKKCKNFDNLNSSCTSENGDYYGNGRKCGAYRELEKEKK